MERFENGQKTKRSPMRFIKKLTVGKVLKFIAVLLIITVYVLLFGRMILARNFGIMDRYIWTEKALDAYNSTHTEFDIMSQQLDESMDKNGYYHISNFVYTPQNNELQITVRYNNSTLDVLNFNYPHRVNEGEDFVFTLKDSNGKIYDSYSYAATSNIIYNFRRLVFENVDLTQADTLHLNVYYRGDIHDNAPMSACFKLYDKSIQMHESRVKISYKSPKADKLVQSPNF